MDEPIDLNKGATMQKSTGEREKVRLSLEVSTELNQTLEKLAEKTESGSKTEVLRKAIALMEVAMGAKDRGESVGLLDKQDKVLTKIVGI